MQFDDSWADGSGLKYQRNRYYDPATGQFTQQDPIGLAGGPNLYAFASGDPVNFKDPFGLCPVCLVVWGAYELGSGLYDVYNAAKTARDPNASNLEKTATVGLAAASVFLPGDGYSAAGKVVKWETHHMLPQAFKRQFEGAGLDIEQYTVRMTQESHRLKPSGLHTGSNRLEQTMGRLFQREREPDAIPSARPAE